MKYKVKFQEVVVYEVEFDSDKTPEQLLEPNQNGDGQWFDEMNECNPHWATVGAETIDVADRDLFEMHADDVEVDVNGILNGE